jgi:hypothetical protein
MATVVEVSMLAVIQTFALVVEEAHDQSQTIRPLDGLPPLTRIFGAMLRMLRRRLPAGVVRSGAGRGRDRAKIIAAILERPVME